MSSVPVGSAPESKVLWRPAPGEAERSRLAEFTRWLRAERGLEFDGYDALWRWSVDDLDGFWRAVWDYFEIPADGDPATVLASREMPGADWFPDVRLNYAERIFAGRDASRPAILHASESSPLAELAWGDLRERVAAAAAGLRSLGVVRGDRVVAYLPNIVETVVAFLATASLGAIWSSASPDFGAGSIIDRFAQIQPKVLIAVDGYRYGGKSFERAATVAELRGGISSIETTVIVPNLDEGYEPDAGAGEISWAQLLAAGADAELVFARVPFAHPLWILYSSGTTGLPKAIVQGHGGILLEHLKALNFHLDTREDDRLFWFTTTGWMMWNFLVSGLHTQAAIVLYDGSPGYPDLGRLWDLAAQAGVTHFGTSAAYITACSKADLEPARGRDLGALRTVASTGSPLSPEGFDWIYEQLGADTWLVSMSGGTDLCTAFVGGVPTLPVRRGELQARALGAAVEAWDETGTAVTGEVGELVVAAPMPSMPTGFWGDEDGARYREAYFEMFPGAWRHGDWIEISAAGGAVIHGRSDSTVNRGGIRMGTAEIYRAVLESEAVTDALVVDLPLPGTDGWMILFVVPGADGLSDRLRADLAASIGRRCSPRHVPDEIVAVAAVPRTLSGKVVEVPVKRILLGEDPGRAVSRGSLANPESVDFFIQLAAQMSEKAA